MSIINLEKTFKYNKSLIYCNLDNKIIIECIHLNELFNISISSYNSKFSYFMCDKVKIITIYDIYKNIILEPIQINKFKDSIKIGDILENLKETKYHFFKTFLGAFITKNKLNDIYYNINHNGRIKSILYDNIKFIPFGFEKIFNIYNNKGNIIYNFHYYHNKLYYIRCYDEQRIFYHIFNGNIGIDTGEKKNRQIIYYNKDLKIFKIIYYINKEIIYNEKRNNNNEIINWNKYSIKGKLKEKFFINSKNPPFSKPLKKDYIQLINEYIKNINNYSKIIKSLLKKGKKINYNLLYNYNLEMINFK